MNTKQCYRCGIDFDGDIYLPGAPCPDCQEDVPGRWLKGWPRGKNVTPEEFNFRAELITNLYNKRLSDREIAEELGIAPLTARRWRTKLELPAHDFFPTEKWGPDALDKMRAGAEHTLKVRKPRSIKPVRAGLLAPNGRGFQTNQGGY